jgi:hypothetical protein
VPNTLLAKKKQGAQSLPMGSNGHLALGCQTSQKRLNPGLACVAGMLQVMKMHEVFDPIGISPLGSEAIVQVANLLTQLIQQPG